MSNAKKTEETGFRKDMHALGQGVGTLKDDVGHLAHGAADAARSGASELGQGAQHAVDAAKHKLEDASDIIGEKYEQCRKATCDATESLKDVVVRNPLVSIGTAAAIGLLVGFLYRTLRK